MARAGEQTGRGKRYRPLKLRDGRYLRLSTNDDTNDDTRAAGEQTTGPPPARPGRGTRR